MKISFVLLSILIFLNTFGIIVTPRYSFSEAMQQNDKNFWHWKLPSLGLMQQDLYKNYVPHQFDLWDLAPKKGAGVRVVLLDTGIDFEHPHLHHPIIKNCLSVVEKSSVLSCKVLQNMIFPHLAKKNEAKNALKETVYSLLISNYDLSHKRSLLIDFLRNFGKQTIFHANGNLSKTGKKLVDQIIDYLNKKSDHSQIIPSIKSKTDASAHGTHCYGILHAQHNDKRLSLCPEATVIMIKTCSDVGASDLKLLTKGLKKAFELKADIVCLNVKITDPICMSNPYVIKFEKLLRSISYSIAPAGNRTLSSWEQFYCIDQLAYPACSNAISFDVGAFGCKNGSFPIATFSQFQKNYGPKIVAPGVDILSTMPVDDTCLDAYGFLHGTSMAATIVTGCIALIVAEFGKIFSKQEILKVCYTSTVYLENTSDWQNKTILGTLDLRTALFVLYLLNNIKTVYKQDVHTNFDQFLAKIHQTLKNKPMIKKDTLEDTIGAVALDIMNLMDSKCFLGQEGIDLFPKLHDSAKKRIADALE